MATLFILILPIFIANFSRAQSTNTSLFFDPGPRHLCYTFSNNTSDNPPTSEDFSQCSSTGTPHPPAWSFSWFRAGQEFDGFTCGGNGEPITVTMINNAQDAGDCDLHETTLSYDYPGFAIQKLVPSGNQYNLALYDQWVIEYDVTIQPDNTDCPDCPGCDGYNRKYLTTDFIYYWSECDSCTSIKNLISIIHYNPIHTMAALGPYEEADGYRLQINGPPTITEGTTGHVALDFKEILLKYSSELCHGGVVPNQVDLYSVQIVSSNVNTSSTIDVENVQLSLLNNTEDPTVHPTPSYPAGSTPTYCPQSPPPTTACHVQYDVTSQWSSGFTVDIQLENIGSSSVSGWTLDWALPAPQTVSLWWVADITQTGQDVSATNTSTNGVLNPQSSVDFGFNADTTSSVPPTIPSAFTMNGGSCSVN